MVTVNRRLLFWLVKAYIKKWRKTILLFFLFGLVFFFFLRFFISTLIAKFPLIQKETIGIVGAYTVDNLPPSLLKEVSQGLTSVGDDGNPHPGLASSWDIKDGGKTYVFHLKKNKFFADGEKFTSKTIKYSFSDVKIDRPNDDTITFHLKESYAPFLVTLSRPIFKDGFIGVGNFRIKEINQNGPFVTSLTLAGVDQPFIVKVYQFYPTQEALRLAFILGNVSRVEGLTDLSFRGTDMTAYKNVVVTKETDYRTLVSLFYNTQDKNLSDKKLRDALSYALPNTFSEGVRATSPLSPSSWAYVPDFMRTKDLDHAKILLKAVIDATKTSQLPSLTIATLPQYKPVAETIKTAWEAIGINSEVKVVNGVPDSFEIFLASFNVPKDPDQYSLWHSDQQNNITGYKSLRIDKLLEDGRKTLDTNERIKTYSDFQKYLMDDQPASFLYFPITYSLTRK